MILCAVPLSEKTLVSQIRRMAFRGDQHSNARTGAGLSRRSSAVLAGIGDDCAILRFPRRHDVLVTTDFSLEGVHFRRAWHSPESIGHRCLARGLSDIAAMGGEPVAAFLSLALPPSVPQKWVDRFMRGLLALAEKHGVRLAGGDTSGSLEGILADIVVLGSVPRGKAVLRSAAGEGDGIYVSGELGGAAAALSRMMQEPEGKLNPQDYRRHFFPEPRIELGRVLRQKGLVSAMIDLSDGLSTDLAHICEESGAGAEIEARLIPRARVGRPPHEVDLQIALHGGEDYELLFVVPRGKRIPTRIAGVPIMKIGEITRGRRIILVNQGRRTKLPARGWEHLKK
jgi:thiamine-monophosphate kinase